MSTELATTESAAPSGALAAMAARIGADPQELLSTLMLGVFKDAKPAEFQALVITAQEYQLNPILKELYAFPAKGGGIVPIVSIDGWLKIINRQPKLDGLKVEFSEDGKEATCTIHVKDREHPVVVTEYLEECQRNTEPWKTMPRRMLRHKAIIQAARVAFGIGGVFDEDDGKDAAGMRDANPPATKARANVSATADFPTAPVETESDAEHTPKEEVISPQGKQTKERYVQEVTFLDVSAPKSSNGKTWWSCQVQTNKGAVVELNTFSKSMADRLDGMFNGDRVRVTFTQTAKGGFALEDIESVTGEEVA